MHLSPALLLAGWSAQYSTSVARQPVPWVPSWKRWWQIRCHPAPGTTRDRCNIASYWGNMKGREKAPIKVLPWHRFKEDGCQDAPGGPQSALLQKAAEESLQGDGVGRWTFHGAPSTTQFLVFGCLHQRQFRSKCISDGAMMTQQVERF